MAIVFATKDGDWSDPTVWNTGALPTEEDDVYANNFLVTIDVSPTILSLRNGGGGTTTGGRFILSDGTTLTTTTSVGLSSQAANTTLVTFSSPSPGTANYVGTISTGSGGGGGQAGILNSSTGTLNITGEVRPARNSNSVAYGVINSGSGIINIVGNIIGSTPAPAVGNSSVGTVNIIGDVITGDGDGILNSSLGRINISGNLYGSNSSTNAFAFHNFSSGVVSHVGTIFAGSISPAIRPGSPSQQTFLTGPFIGHPNGTQANIAISWRWNLANPVTYIEVYSTDLLETTPRTLYTADFVGGNPSTADVRLGTTFGPVDELTGTMAVPDPIAVAAQTPVDDTLGIAAVSAEELWAYPLAEMTVAGSVGARLRQAITKQLLGEYLEAFGSYAPGQ
jgi:hypothetical protein